MKARPPTTDPDDDPEGTERTSVMVRRWTRDRLWERFDGPTDSYDAVIRRLLEEVSDDE